MSGHCNEFILPLTVLIISTSAVDTSAYIKLKQEIH